MNSGPSRSFTLKGREGERGIICKYPSPPTRLQFLIEKVRIWRVGWRGRGVAGDTCVLHRLSLGDSSWGLGGAGEGLLTGPRPKDAPSPAPGVWLLLRWKGSDLPRGTRGTSLSPLSSPQGLGSCVTLNKALTPASLGLGFLRPGVGRGGGSGSARLFWL